MKAKIETSPTRFRYITVLVPIDWQSASSKIHEILALLNAKNVLPIANEDVVSVDTKWWDFTFKNGDFRIVYDEWPHGLSIEPRNNASASLLPELVRLISIS